MADPKNSAFAIAAVGILGAVAYYALGGQPGPKAPPAPVLVVTDRVGSDGKPAANGLGTHATVDYAGIPLPAGATKGLYTIHGEAAAWAVLGLTPGEAGYGFAAICATERDAGGASVELPSGVFIIPGTEGSGGPCVDGDHVLEVWTAGHPSAPFDCACGPGCVEILADGTTKTWAAGGKNTLLANQWKAADPATCFRRPCRELQAGAANPPGCR